jgi:hypothetical protein
LLRVASPEFEAIRQVDRRVKKYLDGVCVPFETGTHFLAVPLIEEVDRKLHEFAGERGALVDRFLDSYPTCLDCYAKSQIETRFGLALPSVSSGVRPLGRPHKGGLRKAHIRREVGGHSRRQAVPRERTRNPTVGREASGVMTRIRSNTRVVRETGTLI